MIRAYSGPKWEIQIIAKLYKTACNYQVSKNTIGAFDADNDP